MTGSASAWRDLCATAEDDDPADDTEPANAGQSVGLGANAIVEFIFPASILASVEALAADGLSVDELVALALAQYVAVNGGGL